MVYLYFFNNKIIKKIHNNKRKITSNILNNSIFLKKGIHSKFLKINKDHLAFRYGEFLKTKKFVNTSVFKKKR